MYTTVIADDEKLICDTILSILNTAIPELKSIKVFHDGTEAYDYVRSNKADILLLDIEMPGKSGLDIAQLISDQNHDSYVIIITAYQDFNYAKRAIDCNVDAFLTKPISSDQLVESVRKGLASFEAKNHKMTHAHKVHRSLLQALCADSTLSYYDDFLLCQNTVPLKDLLCTEVLFKDDCLYTLSETIHSTMEQTLTEMVEKDTKKQSVFLLECKDLVKILVFSQGTPELDFIADIAQVMSFYTNSTSQSFTKTYASFGEYRTCLSFAREVDTFYHQAVESNLKNAQKKLSNFVASLSPSELDNFAGYLSKNCNITIERTDIDTILQCIVATVGRSGNSHQGNHIVVSACEYIQQNFNSGLLSLETTADALSISGAHLSRLFKKHTGQTFSDYLLKLRMEHAKFLLDTTNMPTPDIAVATGYDKSAYFRTAFKSYFGMTPLQYRQMICGKEKSKV